MNSKQELWIAGAGAHAKVVAEAAMAAGWRLAGVYDPNLRCRELAGVPVTDTAPAQPGLMFVAAIGDNIARKAEFERLVSRGWKPITVIHPSACVSPAASVAAGSVVMAQAVLQADCSIGENCIVNTASVVEHDCTLSAHSQIGPGSVLCGKVILREGAFVGAGATVIPEQEIGAWAIVAAGATVVKPVEGRTTVAGTPARERA